MTRVRENLATITANVGNNNYFPPVGYKVGKVYAVILDEKSVPQQQWEQNGGWDGIGTILYEEYSGNVETKLEDINDNFLNSLPTALPLFPNQKYYPLPGEIVFLVDLPSAPSPITDKSEETYYLSVINAWNSSQYNGLFLEEAKDVLYKSFNENPDFRGLRSFEGDFILEGRFGNSIRFGSTNKSGIEDQSPWSTNPSELNNNPILILSNNHNYKPTGSDAYVENINVDDSSIYLTSKQSIPLNIGNIKLSNITAPIGIKDYTNPQVVVNANRVVVSSNNDEVFLIGKKGVELYSQGPVYLQSDKVGITLQDNLIFLGPSSKPTETQPVLLGNDVKELLINLVKALSDFSTALVTAKVTPEGTGLMDVNLASEQLQVVLDFISTKLTDTKYLLSQTTKVQ